MNRNNRAGKAAMVVLVTMIAFALLMFVSSERPVPVVYAQAGNTALVVPLCGMQAYMAGQTRVVTMDLTGNSCTSGTGGGGGGGGVQYPSGTVNTTPIGTVALGRTATNVLTPLLVNASGNLEVTVGTDSPCYVLNGVGTGAAVASANCKSTAGTFKGLRAINTSGTLAYVRMYNLGGTPTCSSATGFVESIPIPASTTGAGIVDILSAFPYSAGVAYCVTGGAGNADNTAPPAGVFITIAYN